MSKYKRTVKQIKEDLQMNWDKYCLIKSAATEQVRGLTSEESRISEEILDEMAELKSELKIAEAEYHVSGYMGGHPEEIPIDGGFTNEDEPGKDGWGSFGEMLRSTVEAGMPNGRVDYSQELVQSIYKTGLLVPLCREVPISKNSNTIKIPGIDESSRADGSRQGGIRVYNESEAGEKTKSKPKFRNIQLTLNKKIGLCYLTDELIEDTTLLEAYVRNGFRKEFAWVLDDEIINGTGVGQFLGILNSACVVSIAKESGQPSGGIVYENILKMFARFNGNIGSAVFLAHKSCIPALFTMNLAIGTAGAPVFVPSDLKLGQPASLFGIKLLFVEQCAAVGTTGDLILADLSHYLIASKKNTGLTPMSAMSIHVRFVYDESCIRFVLRADGQPEFSTAITPYKGSDTESPFVKIDTRS